MFFTFFLMLNAIAQKVDLSLENQWQTYLEKNGIKIEYQVVDCNYTSDGIYLKEVLFRYTNNNNYAVNLSWNLELYNAQGCTNCSSQNGENTFSLELNTNQIDEADCDLSLDNRHKLFVKRQSTQTSSSALLNFDFKNFQIVKK